MLYKVPRPYSAPPYAVLHRPEDPTVVTLPVPGYRQSRNYSCGFAVMLMVLRTYQSRLSGKALFAALGTARDGTGQSAMVRVLRTNGFSANLRYDMDFTRICTAIDTGKVLVGYLEDEEHWIVVYGYGKTPKRVYIADPEEGKPCEYDWTGMEKRLGGFAMVCSSKAKSSSEPLAVVSNASEQLSLFDL